MLEHILVRVLHNVNVKLTSEDQVFIHGFSCDLCYLALGELKEGIAA